MGALGRPDRLKRAREADIVRYSDDELRSKILRVDDPEGLDNLIDILPELDYVPEIEFGYNVTPPKGIKRDRVHCVHCGGKRHWRGYVMLCDDGTRFLVGKDCGKDHYKANFNLVEHQFKANDTRQRRVRRFDRILATLPSAIADIREVMKSETVEAFDHTRAIFIRDAEELFTSLERVAATREPFLEYMKSVPDREAEERRSEREDKEIADYDRMSTSAKKNLRRRGVKAPKRDTKPLFKRVPVELGKLNGVGLFMPDLSPRSRFSECLHKLVALKSEMEFRPTDAFGIEEMRKLFDRFRSVLNNVDEAIALTLVPRDFFGPASLQRVAKWANEKWPHRWTCEAHGRVLRLKFAGDSEWVEIKATVAPPIPELSGIEDLRIAHRIGRADEDI